jgi:hypothetical protein
MKKAVCVVLILTMAIFLVTPLSGEAGSGHGGGHWSGGGHGGWWVPLAIFGGAAVLSSFFYSAYNQPAPVVIQEQRPVHPQPSPSVVTPASTEKIFVYPKLGQSEELQAKDRYECHSWAVSQTKYDPTQPVSGLAEAQVNKMHADYRRAEDACLDGRGYTVR